MSNSKSILFACSRLVDLAGAEITTLELVEVFRKMGWNVSVAAFELSGDMRERLERLEASYFDLSSNAAFAAGIRFDVAWLHHSVSAYRILMDSAVDVDKVVYSSLSYFEPLEAPPISALKVSKYLVNSEENLRYFIGSYPDLAAKAAIFHNSAPAEFWSDIGSGESALLRRLAVVSNHVPGEVFEAIAMLAERQIQVDLFGLDGRRERITPVLLRNYDAVISIGKTVQYCIASRIPVYCYDHFGGDGWLTRESFDNGRIHNFSGRSSRGKVRTQRLLDELIEGFAPAAREVPFLQELGRRYFVLEDNVTDVLARLDRTFSLDSLSRTDINIVLRQNQVFLRQRNIIANLDQKVDSLRSEVAHRDGEVATRDQEIAAQEGAITRLQAKVTVLDQLVSSLRLDLARQDGQIATRDQEIAAQEGATTCLRAEVAELNQKIGVLHLELVHRDGEIAARDKEIGVREGEITCLRAELAEMVGIRRSYSWRCTRPLRTIARWLVRRRDNMQVRISWVNFLLRRSHAVLEHQGFAVFVDRVFRYTKGWMRRKLASSRAVTNRVIEQEALSECADDKLLVSFVIPVYDRTDVLRIAINSALAQTVSKIEVIIVTDGSPQETLDVVNEFKADPRVKIFNYPRSSGNAVRGRNKGIREARGRYIAFLDSDDVATPDRVELCLPLLESGKADVVYGAWQAIVDGSRDIPGIVDGQVILSPDADLKMLLDVCVPCQSTVIVRKSLLERSGYLKPSMEYREDHELWARLAYFGGAFRSLPHVFTKLRLHSGNNELNFCDEDNRWLSNVHVEYKMRGPRPKKLAFILPGVGISGGIAVIFKHAALLMDAGHDAIVINVGDVGDGGWFSGNPVPIIHVSDLRTYVFEDIDLLFATGWSTVEWLNRFPAARKLYFVQSDERRFFSEPALKRKIHDTYLTPCEYLTEALWIKNMLREEFGHDAAYVPNGLDTAQFYPDTPIEPKVPGKVRVLLEGPIVIPFKGMADSYAAIEGLNCEVWIVSSAGRPPVSWKFDRFFEGVPFGDMRRIYSSCDIFLKMSRIEGFFGPPMEAMACGCAVVVGKVTGYDEYIIDTGNALVVELGDVQGARQAVQSLISDESLRRRLIECGHKTVMEWNWDQSAAAMLDLIDGALV